MRLPTRAILRPLALSVLLIALILAGRSLTLKTTSSRPEVHYHAGFKVYIDGVLQDYSDSRYMQVKPCVAGETKEIENEQLEKAHLHDRVGDVVHIEHEGGKWSDLFQNIGVSFDKSKPVVGFANGKEITDILQQKINSNESIVIIVGDRSNSQNLVQNPVPIERIKEIEAKSEACGK